MWRDTPAVGQLSWILNLIRMNVLIGEDVYLNIFISLDIPEQIKEPNLVSDKCNIRKLSTNENTFFKFAFQSRCQSEAECNCVTWMHNQVVSYPTKIENHIRSLWIHFYTNFMIRLQNQKHHPLGYNHPYSRQSVVWRQD